MALDGQLRSGDASLFQGGFDRGGLVAERHQQITRQASLAAPLVVPLALLGCPLCPLHAVRQHGETLGGLHQLHVAHGRQPRLRLADAPVENRQLPSVCSPAIGKITPLRRRLAAATAQLGEFGTEPVDL